MRSFRKIFTSLLLTAALTIGMIPAALPAYAADDHNGWQAVNALYLMTDHDEDGMAVINSGNYYLSADPIISRPLLIKNGTTVTICLHGHALNIKSDNDSKYVFYIEEGGILNIEDCGAGNGELANLNPNCEAAIYNEGGLNISGGNIGSMNQAIRSKIGRVNISNGVINAGTNAIYLTDDGSLIVQGNAEITGPDAGIVAQRGRIAIAGGTIRSTDYDSTGIWASGNSIVDISDGMIEGVKYGLQALGDTFVHFTGGEISAIGTEPVGLYSRDSNIMIASESMLMPILYGKIDAENSEVAITAGYFTDSPGAYLANTHKVADSGYSSYPYEVVEKDKFTVTFTDGSGKTLKTQSVHEGLPATAPAKPTRSGYTFTGWDKEFSKITKDLTVNALWKAVPKPKYTVTFTDGSGKTLKTQSVTKGSAATAPADPTRSGYTFTGWDKEFSNITKDLTVNALWKAAAPAKKTVKDLPAVKISKPKAAKKALTVKWKKLSKKNRKKIKKIEIQYSTDKKFKKGVKTKYASSKKTSLKIKKLKSRKTYYIRIRSYTKSGDITHVSKWSSKKKVKVK